MKKILEKIRKRFGYLTIHEFNQAVDSAVSRAVNETERWYNNGPTHSPKTGLQESSDDRFRLYESHYKKDYESNSAKSEEDKQAQEDFKILESFTGGWHPHFDRTYDQSVQQLHRMQEVTLSKYFSDPHCRSIIDNWVNYTIGSGLKFNVGNKKVEEVISEFRRKNGMAQKEKEILQMLFTEGEAFLAYFINLNTGDIKLRRVRPQEIIDIETHPEDVENYFAYHWSYQDSRTGTTQIYSVDRWVQDIEYDNYLEETRSKGGMPKRRSKRHPELKTSIQMQFIKLGIDNEIRGRVPLQPVLRYLKYYEDWLVDRIIMNHERSKVVWIKSIKGRSQSDWANKSSPAQRAPKGGIMLVETDNETYRIESSEIRADEAKEDGMAILHAIGAGSSLPLHILNQRADMQNYSSIRKADTPFSQFIKGKQTHAKEAFEKMYREVIDQKVRAKELPEYTKIYDYSQESLRKAFHLVNEAYIEGKNIEDLREEVDKLIEPEPDKKRVRTIDIPLGIEFPEIIREDLKAQAEVLRIHKEMGIASLATLAAKAGYNWKEELHNLLVEKETMKELNSYGQDPEDDPDNNQDGDPGNQGDDGKSEPTGDKGRDGDNNDDDDNNEDD